MPRRVWQSRPSRPRRCWQQRRSGPRAAVPVVIRTRKTDAKTADACVTRRRADAGRRRVERASVDDGREHEIRDTLEALEAADLLEQTGSEADERHIARGIDPEERRACADAAERVRRRGEAEVRREDAGAAQEEAEADVRREVWPAALLAGVVPEIVRLEGGVIRRREPDDRGREDACITEAPTLAERVREAEEVADGRVRAARGHLGLVVDERVERLEQLGVEEAGAAVAHDDRDAAAREVATHAERRVAHAERLEQLGREDVAKSAAAAVEAAHHLGEHRMRGDRAVIDDLA